MLKRFGVFFAFAAGILLISPEAGYIFRAWRESAEDRWNWIFLLAAFLLFLVSIRRIRELSEEKTDSAALTVLIPSLFLYAGAMYLTFHWAVYSSVLLTVFSCLWLFCGWRSCAAAVPVLGLAVMGSVGISYLRNTVFGDESGIFPFAWFGIACFWIVWSLLMLRFDRAVPKKADFFFGCAVVILASGGGLLLRGGMESASPFDPDFSAKIAGMTLERTPVREEDKNFFRKSAVERYRVSDGSVSSGILVIRPGTGLHEIHPAGHCLRSAGSEVLYDRIVDPGIGGHPFRVNEVLASRGKRRNLYWAWYSCKRFSTGSFMHFRLREKKGRDWVAVQIATPVEDGNLEAARERLRTICRSVRPSS